MGQRSLCLFKTARTKWLRHALRLARMLQSPLDKERLPREIEATDRQIDQLVYELYGLGEDEIRIVEEATQ